MLVDLPVGVVSDDDDTVEQVLLAQAVFGKLMQGSVAKDWRQSEVAVALRRSGGCCEMVVEHAHGLRQRRGPNAKSSLQGAPRP